MPLEKLQFRPGVNREGTTLANEGGWFESQWVRFRSGYPEKIGGWQLVSSATFIGTCRSLWNWVTLKLFNLMGVGTEKKFYIEYGGVYYDITPIRETTVLTNPFATTNTSNIVTVTDTNHGAITGDYVTFSGATTVAGLNLNFEYQITYVDSNTYTIVAASNASATTTGGGTVTAAYQLNIGSDIGATQTGWGAGLWGGVTTGSAVNQLNGAINNSVTTVVIDSTTGFPSAGTLLIGAELITYTAKTATDFTGCVRGALGTAAASHLDNALVANATGYSGWGQSISITNNTAIRLWSQTNFGQDLLFNPRGGGLYYWTPGFGVTPLLSTRGILIGAFSGTANIATNTTLTVTAVTSGTIQVGMFIAGTGIPVGAYVVSFGTGTGGVGTYILSQATTATTTGITITGTTDVPQSINEILVSDSSRIVIAFGCNDYLTSDDPTTLDPMLIRWSAQESYTEWTPSATNQAGSYRLSHGSQIIGALQTRQEIVVWTDAAIYAMQYLGPPFVWGFTLLADNISIASPSAMATAAGVVYWMGVDKFYVYSGRVETLPCSVRQYVFENINREQYSQFFASTNEGYSEIWWFYCSANSSVIDRYVIFNYLDRVWYYGTLGRTAWIDSPLRDYPIAATLANQLVAHENGNDDGSTNPATPTAIYSYIQSSDFDIGDGHNYGFVWRMIPDITFDSSTTPSPLHPSVTLTMRPRQNPGAPYGTAPSPTVTTPQTYSQSAPTYNVQEFTEIVYTRVRGRQMAFKIESSDIGVAWQLGVPRIDIRPDGKR